MRLLGSSCAELEREATALVVLLLEREPGAALPLEAAGAVPALVAMAERGSSREARDSAAGALASLRRSLGGGSGRQARAPKPRLLS